MTKLSDTQSIILSAAAQRPDGNLLPLPGSLRGGAAGKVVTALLTRGLIREEVTDSQARLDPALNTIWRNDEDGRAVLLRVTSAGLEAVGVEAEPAAESGEGVGAANESAAALGRGAESGCATSADMVVPEARQPRTARTAAQTGTTREGTKQAALIAMLRRPEGATITQIVEATGWQPHYADIRIMPR